MSYDPDSNDSMFTRIIQHLEAADDRALKQSTEVLAALNELRLEVKATNGRVRQLELWRAVVTTKTATIATGASVGVAVLVWSLKVLFGVG